MTRPELRALVVHIQIILDRARADLAGGKITKARMDTYPPSIVIDDVDFETQYITKRKIPRTHSAYESARRQLRDRCNIIIQREQRLIPNLEHQLQQMCGQLATYC